MATKSHVLVFGASGVSGWAVASQALVYPTKDTFDRVTALTNRPLSAADAKFPDDPRLQLASGIDLTGSVASVAEGLKSKVNAIETVTHVIFTAYIEKPDFASLVRVNEALVKTAVAAVEQTSPQLRSVILQTGGKGYGVEYEKEPDVKIVAPISENTPRLPKPYYDNVFYYNQYDALIEMSKGKKWTFNEVRPDVIVGFTPGSNFMNVAQGLAFYLLLYKEVHGKGSSVPFIGFDKSWTNTHTDSFQDILAQGEIYLAVNSGSHGITNGASFNCTNGPVTTWKEKWPKICAYFDLKGVEPSPDGALSAEQLTKFAKDNRTTWEALAKAHGLKPGLIDSYSWTFLWSVTTFLDFNREYDLSAIRSTGFTEQIDTAKGYTTAFDRMRAAQIIP